MQCIPSIHEQTRSVGTESLSSAMAQTRRALKFMNFKICGVQRGGNKGYGKIKHDFTIPFAYVEGVSVK